MLKKCVFLLVLRLAQAMKEDSVLKIEAMLVPAPVTRAVLSSPSFLLRL